MHFPHVGRYGGGLRSPIFDISVLLSRDNKKHIHNMRKTKL